MSSHLTHETILQEIEEQTKSSVHKRLLNAYSKGALRQMEAELKEILTEVVRHED